MFSAISAIRPNINTMQVAQNNQQPQAKLHSQPKADCVSFSGIRRISLEDFPLKGMPGIPCPYCKGVIFTDKDIKKFGKEMTFATGEQLQQALAKNIGPQRMTIQKLVALDLIRESRKNPQSTIQELLTQVEPEAEARLVVKQNAILNRAKESCIELNGHVKQRVDNDFKVINSIIQKSSQATNFKRSDLIRGFVDLWTNEPSEPNKKILASTIDILRELPSSSMDKDAFIVKYHRRTSREAAEELLAPYKASGEHVHPFNKGGENKASNYLDTHAHCNEWRESRDFDLFLDEDPRVANEYIPYHIDYLKNRFGKKPPAGLETYLSDICKTMNTQSKGKVNLKP